MIHDGVTEGRVNKGDGSRRMAPEPPFPHIDGNFGTRVLCVPYGQLFPSQPPRYYWTPCRARFRQLWAWDEPEGEQYRDIRKYLL